MIPQHVFPETARINAAGHLEIGWGDDVLLRDTRLPKTKPGDLIALGAGAHTLSLSSNYTMVPRSTVLFVKDGQARVVHRRETFEDLIARDALDTNVKGSGKLS